MRSFADFFLPYLIGAPHREEQVHFQNVNCKRTKYVIANIYI